jgi:hypothetical protein
MFHNKKSISKNKEIKIIINTENRYQAEQLELEKVSTLSLLKRKRNERDELLFLNKIETN